MPFCRLTLTPMPVAEAAHLLASEMTDLIARILRKRGDLTSVLIETPVAAHWAIAADQIDMAAQVEVFVTAGTNTMLEKREFVAAAMACLRRYVPGLSPATYVIVHELPATDWGYNGQTQADRAASIT